VDLDQDVILLGFQFGLEPYMKLPPHFEAALFLVLIVHCYGAFALTCLRPW
jgi:hypothetical protein